MDILSNPLFMILFPTGVMVWIIGWYVLKYPPKKINKLYGYRTPRSTKSQEAWDYAQYHGTKRMIHGAQIMLLLGIAGLFTPPSETLAPWLAIFIVIACLCYPLILTERELKDKF